MPSPDDQRLPDEEKGPIEPVSPYKYTTPEKAAASIEVRNKVLSTLAGGDVARTADSAKKTEAIDSRSFDEKLSDARTEYERLCAEHGLPESTMREHRQAFDEYYSLMERIPEEVIAHMHGNMLDDLYEDLPPVARKRVLEVMRERKAGIEMTWIPRIFADDFDEGIRTVKELLRMRQMNERQAMHQLRRAGSLSVATSRRLLAAFPKLLKKYIAKTQWGYEPEAFAGLDEAAILDALDEEEKKEPWDWISHRTVAGLLQNKKTPEPLLRIVKTFIEAHPERYEGEVLSSLRSRFSFDASDGTKPAWVKAWARELHERKNSHETMPVAYLEDVDALERHPEYPRLIARLRAHPFFEDDKHIEIMMRSFDMKFLLALEAMDFDADETNIVAYLKRNGYGPGTWDEATKPRILVACLTGREPTFAEAMLGKEPIGVGRSGMFNVAYVMSLKPTENECVQVLEKAAVDQFTLENIARSALIDELVRPLEKDARDRFLKPMIMFGAALSNSSEIHDAVSRCLRLLTREEARVMARTLSMLPIAPRVPLESVFFDEAYEDVFDEQARAKKSSTVPKKQQFPAIRLLRKSEDRASQGKPEKIPPTYADALRLADTYGNAIATAKEKAKRQKKPKNRVSEFLTKISSYFSPRAATSMHEGNAEHEGTSTNAKPDFKRPRNVAPLSAVAQAPQVLQMESFPDFVGRIDWTPFRNSSYLLMGFIDIEEGMAGEQRETDDDAVLDALRSATRMPLQNGYEHELLLYGARPGAVIPLPLRSTGIRAADENGEPLPLSFERDGRPRLEEDVAVENVRVKLQLPKRDEEPTLPADMTIDELRAAMPPALAPYAVPKLRRDLLPATLSEVITRAKDQPAAAATETLRDAVRTHMQYDDRSEKDYENIIGIDEIGRNAYLERIIEKKRGVCGQFSALYAELLRHAGIPCVEANVLMLTQTNITENDYHRTTLIPCPGADGGVEPMIMDPTGRDYILRALMRQLCETVRIPPVSPSLEAFQQTEQPTLEEAEEHEEQPIAERAWRATMHLGHDNVSPPVTASAADVRALAVEMGIDRHEPLLRMIQGLHDRCMRTPSAFQIAAETPQKAELLKYFMEEKETSERLFFASLGFPADEFLAPNDED